MPEGDWFCPFCTARMNGGDAERSSTPPPPERSSTPPPPTADQTPAAAAPPPAAATQAPQPPAEPAAPAAPVAPAAPSEGAPPEPVADATTLSIKELRDALRARGVDYSACIEKSELVALLQRVLAQ